MPLFPNDVAIRKPYLLLNIFRSIEIISLLQAICKAERANFTINFMATPYNNSHVKGNILTS